ncbi:hypothetical protein AB1N83_013368, partial [Pleurotus pulmonarius]
DTTGTPARTTAGRIESFL